MAYIEDGFFHISNTPRHPMDKAQTYPPLPEPIRKFLLQFETTCVVDCCGIDAFLFSPPDPEDLRWRPPASLSQLIEREIEKVEEFPGKILTIWELNQHFEKEDFVFLLQYLRDGILEIEKKKRS
ncbi:MAG TPA: DUF6331 family protein [Abditibacterium sp.]|jgi:hypothetical protein